MKLTRRTTLVGAAATLAMPAIGARAQASTIRWGEMLAPTHPQVQMIDRIAKEVKEKTAGRVEIQSFPNGQLGSGKDMMDSIASGALHMTTDGAAALGAFLPQLSVIEAPYLWRDAAHMGKAAGSDIFKAMNEDLVKKRGIRMLSVTYYGKRHITTGKKEVRSVADMKGFKLRVPPVDTFRAMAEAWGAQATPINFNELYLALSQGAVDGQENPLPTIASAKLPEVQKFLVLSGHIITPRLVVANEDFLKRLSGADRAVLDAAIAAGAAWQDGELARQEGTLVDTFKGQGMTVIEPDVDSFRKPVLAAVPAKFEDKWGKGVWEKLAAL
jgi:tripartite ATP-independent transporter DctP family solute receptor